MLYFMIGLPRSGKSTIARWWARHEVSIKNGTWHYHSNERNPRVIVCPDQIRLTFGSRFNPNIEHIVHAIKQTMVETLLYDHDVLIDATHTTIGQIKQVFRIDPNAQFCFIHCEPSVCKERAITTQQDDLLPVIDKMYGQLVELCGGEPTDESVGDAVNKIVQEMALN